MGPGRHRHPGHRRTIPGDLQPCVNAASRLNPWHSLDSGDRRNTYLMKSVAMARRGRERNLERGRRYWGLLASGLGTVQASWQVGIGRRSGLRWRRENGGLRRDLGGSAPVVGRCLSLFVREWVQSLIAQGIGVREVDCRLGRGLPTICRELRRSGDRERHDAGAAHQHAVRRANDTGDPNSPPMSGCRTSSRASSSWSGARSRGAGSWRSTTRRAVTAATIYHGLYMSHRGALRWHLTKKPCARRTLR